jgi:hypothetical protein
LESGMDFGATDQTLIVFCIHQKLERKKNGNTKWQFIRYSYIERKTSFSLRVEVLYNIFVESGITITVGRLMKSVFK